MTIPVYQWQPSTAEIAASAGIGADDVVRFDHNTSPYPPPWAASAAAEAAAAVNEYPAADYSPLREAAAAYCGVTADRVVPGAGVDEMIDLCARAFLAPGGRAVATAPTYPLYRIVTMRRGAEYADVARPADLAWPGERLAAAAEGADLVWLCLPDNPVGDRATDEAVAAVVAAAGGLVVIDAAYAEFAGDTWAAWLDRHPSLVVLHTMSKAFGLAAARVGYSLSSPELAARLHAVRPPGSVSTVSAEMAVRALADPGYAAAAVAAIAAARDALARRLTGLGLAVHASTTNFLLCRAGEHAHRIERELMAEGLVVRSFGSGPLVDHLRFTVRTGPDHDLLIDALRRHLP